MAGSRRRQTARLAEGLGPSPATPGGRRSGREPAEPPVAAAPDSPPAPVAPTIGEAGPANGDAPVVGHEGAAPPDAQVNEVANAAAADACPFDINGDVRTAFDAHGLAPCMQWLAGHRVLDLSLATSPTQDPKRQRTPVTKRHVPRFNKNAPVTRRSPAEERKRQLWASFMSRLFASLGTATDDDTSGKVLMRIILAPYLLQSLRRRVADVWETRLEEYTDSSQPIDGNVFRFSRKSETKSAPKGNRTERAYWALRNTGAVGRASRILTRDTEPTAINEETFAKLRDLHPAASRDIGTYTPAASYVPGPGPHQTRAAFITSDDVIDAICQSDLSTTPGTFGYCMDGIKLLLGDVEDARQKPPPIVTALCAIGKMIEKGKVDLLQPLLTSRLIAIKKGGTTDKPRPIAMSDLLIRLPCKAFAHRFYDSPRAPSRIKLLDNQFGVGSPGGAEALVHTLRAVMSQANAADTKLYVTALDSANAFNRISRKQIFDTVKSQHSELANVFWALYGRETVITCEGVEGETARRCVRTIMSAEGVRQGDPLGPLFFSIGMRARGQWLTDELKKDQAYTGTWLAYLDDTYVVSTSSTAGRDLVDDWNSGPQDGTALNVAKTVHTDTETMLKADSDVFLALGSVIGSPETECRAVASLTSKIAEELRIYESMSMKHDTLIMTKMCWLPRVNFLLRTVDLSSISGQAALKGLERAQEEYLDRLRGTKPRQYHDTTKALERLPVREGGIGMRSPHDIAPLAYAASLDAAAKEMASRDILFGIYSLAVEADAVTPQAHPDKNLSQRKRVDKNVTSRHLATLDTFHLAPVAGQDPKKTVYARMGFYERREKIARQWMEQAAPGFEPGSVLLSNTDVAQALARWTNTIFLHDEYCIHCGVGKEFMGPRHRMLCPKGSHTQRHDDVQNAVADVLDSSLRARGLYPLKRIPVLSTSVASRATRRADLHIPAGAFAGVNEEYIDFRVCTLPSPTLDRGSIYNRARTTINAPSPGTASATTTRAETVEEWTKAQLTRTVDFSVRGKIGVYQRHGVTTPVVPLGMTRGGFPHETTSTWLHQFKLPLRLALRRAMSFAVLQHCNRSVLGGLAGTCATIHF